MFDDVILKIQSHYPGIDKEALKLGFDAVLANVKDGNEFYVTASTDPEATEYNFAADNIILAFDMFKAGDKKAALQQVIAAFGAEDCDQLCKALEKLNNKSDESKIEASFRNVVEEFPIGDEQEYSLDENDDIDPDEIDIEDPNKDPAGIPIEIEPNYDLIEDQDLEDVFASLEGDKNDYTDVNENNDDEDEDAEDNDIDGDNEDDNDAENLVPLDEENEYLNVEVPAALAEPVFGLPVSEGALETSITGNPSAAPVMPMETTGDPDYTNVDEDGPYTLDELVSFIPNDIDNDVLSHINRIVRKGKGSQESLKEAHNLLKQHIGK